MTEHSNADNNGNNQLRIAVIGMGPVGCIIATHLIEAGATVIACDVIHSRIDSIKKSGIKLVNVFEKHVKPFDACYTIQELEMYDIDLAIVSTKTPSLKKVMEQLASIDSGKMFVMVAQNGIDNEKIVADAIEEERSLRMVINFAGNMRDEHTVHVSFFNPPNYLAAFLRPGEEMADKIVALFNSVALDTEIPEDIQDYIWEKAILNAALSPVCAITRRTMKDVLDFPHGADYIEAIIDESVRVAEAEGIILDRKFRRFSLRYLKNAGHHRPSMMADLEAGRATEIEQLNGRIVEYGKKHHIPTPLNLSISEIIRMLEKSTD